MSTSRTAYTESYPQLTYLVFKRWEPTSIPVLLFLLIVIPAALSSTLVPHLGLVKGVALAYFTHWSTVLASVAFYRLSPFHPLARYPGPVPCKLSKFWGLYKERDGKQHLYVQHLHDIYGDVVRIGTSPRHLAVAYRL